MTRDIEKYVGQVWYMSKDEKLDKDTNRKAKVEQSTREAVNTLDSWLYNQVTVSS